MALGSISDTFSQAEQCAIWEERVGPGDCRVSLSGPVASGAGRWCRTTMGSTSCPILATTWVPFHPYRQIGSGGVFPGWAIRDEQSGQMRCDPDPHG
jgi:hypothetical protein